ncbi:hypothetical protein M408DRAFT_20559 [Serendipita vermifera MAFF 305830]|uniref:EKC/KEOPS complex subunit GON7 n=1 Tax=Serendipita vermifera MAFF 305830 TaxID=933852 RepID=A0A0C3B5X8_SERVB|nr:hypothetical protein M408DRAFT_20559 [Serendipita vermifera MAFF 305830]
MSSERKITVHYSLKVPKGIDTPVSKSNQPIPAENTISFSAGDQSQFDYKKVLAAIQEAKTVTGQDTLTPWRDAVGDAEKGKDAKPSKSKANQEPDEEDEDEEEKEE